MSNLASESETTNDPDYYAVLGVSQDATPGEIEAAYDRLALTFQPDADKEPLEPERLTALNESFDVLDDPAKHQEYDRARGIERSPGFVYVRRESAVVPFRRIWPPLALAGFGLAAITAAIVFLAVSLVGGDGGIVTTASGLKYVDLEEGTGPPASEGQTVLVHYTGRLEDGTKFDSSLDRGVPIIFRLGASQVIAGWDEGLRGMRKGGLRKLIVPPELGYGPTGVGERVPPNATLVFEVKLVEIRP